MSFVSPMLLQYAANNEPFIRPEHASFLKLDGIRLIVSYGDELKLYTRHNNDVTAKFPELHNPPFGKGTILDGELIVSDNQGKPDFEAMMQRFLSKSSKVKATFCAFDIIRYNGIQVTDLPLHRRLNLLDKAFKDTEQYKHVQQANGDSIQYFEAVKQFGLEGIVIKDLNSKYEIDRRSYSWQKVINWTYVDVFITGFKKDGFGWLTSMLDENGRMRPTGIIEFGVSPEHKKALNSVKRQLIVSEDKQFVHLEPRIRAKVKTRNWTKNGMLRSPVFVEFIL